MTYVASLFLLAVVYELGNQRALRVAVVIAFLEQVIPVLAGTIVRRILRRPSQDPSVPFTIAIIAAGHVLRAFAGHALTVRIDPGDSLGTRIVFWSLICVSWTPCSLYALRRVAVRRNLLNERSTKLSDLNHHATRLTSQQQTDQALLQHVLLNSVLPQLTQIRDRLARRITVAEARDTATLLAAISEELTQFFTARPPSVQMTSTGEAAVSWWKALHLPARHPIRAFAAGQLILTATLLSLALPMRTPNSLSVNVAITALITIAVFATLTGARRLVPARREQMRTRTYLFFCVLACSLGAQAQPLLHPVAPTDAGPVPAVIAVIAVTAGWTGNALASLRTNIAAERTAVAQLDLDLQRVREQLDRTRITLLPTTHNSVQSKIASCAMALNFYSDGALPEDPTRTAVIDQLAAVIDRICELYSFPGERCPSDA